MKELAGKAAIVTGAASGIGLGIATALAEAGVSVALADLRAEALAPAVEQVRALGVQAVGVTVDVSDPASVEAAGHAAVEAFGGLHIAVNNAGVAMHGTPVEQVGLDEWDWVIGVNIRGVINGVRAFLPLIRGGGGEGHVVNTGSVSSFFVREGRHQGAYAMTKYAVLALSEALEQELAGSGIGVSVLCPGAVRTSIWQGAATRPEKFGGAYRREAQEALAAGGFAGAALDPVEVGRRVVRAIRQGEFYVLTHAGEKEVIAARFARILEAFDVSN